MWQDLPFFEVLSSQKCHHVLTVFWCIATNSLISLFGEGKRLRSLPLLADKLTKGGFSLLGTTDKEGDKILHLCAVSICCT